jgi:RNA-binding protein YlmH
MDIKKYSVSSLRIDLIISERFNISRVVSQELIKNGNVKINARVILNPVFSIKDNDMISVKTKGKMKVIEIGSTTKSGKIMVTLGKLL